MEFFFAARTHSDIGIESFYGFSHELRDCSKHNMLRIGFFNSFFVCLSNLLHFCVFSRFLFQIGWELFGTFDFYLPDNYEWEISYYAILTRKLSESSKKTSNDSQFSRFFCRTLICARSVLKIALADTESAQNCEITTPTTMHTMIIERLTEAPRN